MARPPNVAEPGSFTLSPARRLCLDAYCMVSVTVLISDFHQRLYNCLS